MVGTTGITRLIPIKTKNKFISTMIKIGRASCRERRKNEENNEAEDGIRARNVTGVQTCALPIYGRIGLPTFPKSGMRSTETRQKPQPDNLPLNQTNIIHP